MFKSHLNKYRTNQSSEKANQAEVELINKLRPTKKPKASKTKQFLRLLALLKPHTKLLTLGSLALLFASLINLSLPWLIKLILSDNAYISLENDLFKIAAGLIFVFAFQSLLFYFRHLYFHSIGYKVSTELRSKLYNSLLKQDINYFDNAKVGDLLSRLSADTDVLQRAITVNSSVVLRYLIQVIGGALMMFIISAKLSLYLLLIIPIFAVSGSFLGKKLSKLSLKLQVELGGASSVAEECLSSIKTVKNFCGESKENLTYTSFLTNALDAGLKRTRFAAFFSSSMVFLMHSLLAIVLCFGIKDVLSQNLSIADLSAFLLYGLVVAVSFGFLIGVWEEAMQALGASERVFELMDSSPEIQSSSSSTQVPSIFNKNEILTFKNINFNYPGRENLNVLKDISFEVAEGETIALVGPSGAGKTTIASLISRFYDPVQGSINYKGVDIRKFDIPSFRSEISTVEQNPMIFSLSIKENIAYARPDASFEEIKQAAEAANLKELIEKLPQGIDTLVGNKGLKLSGGEKQRVAIARAILKNSPLLVLDEATSSLDSKNEFLVQEALKKLTSNKTSIIIAHRLSTIQHADKVLVLKDGELKQTGTHQSLVKEEGLYKNLVNLQLLEI